MAFGICRIYVRFDSISKNIARWFNLNAYRRNIHKIDRKDRTFIIENYFVIDIVRCKHLSDDKIQGEQ